MVSENCHPMQKELCPGSLPEQLSAWGWGPAFLSQCIRRDSVAARVCQFWTKVRETVHNCRRNGGWGGGRCTRIVIEGVISNTPLAPITRFSTFCLRLVIKHGPQAALLSLSLPLPPKTTGPAAGVHANSLAPHQHIFSKHLLWTGEILYEALGNS